jgi:hypothetical protein
MFHGYSSIEDQYMNRGKEGQLQTPQLARRGTENKAEKRDRVIRVRSRTFDDLVDLGESMLDDFDDIISRLIREHRERQGKMK